MKQFGPCEVSDGINNGGYVRIRLTGSNGLSAQNYLSRDQCRQLTKHVQSLVNTQSFDGLNLHLKPNKDGDLKVSINDSDIWISQEKLKSLARTLLLVIDEQDVE